MKNINKPKNAGKPWDDTQRGQLREHVANDATIDLIAESMGRSTGAIRTELKNLKLKITKSKSKKKKSTKKPEIAKKSDIEILKSDVNNIANTVEDVVEDANSNLIQLLNTWLAHEILTPKTMPGKDDLELLNQTIIPNTNPGEPWYNPQWTRNPKNNELGLFWYVHLGNINIAKLTNALKDKSQIFDISPYKEQHNEFCSVLLVLNEKGFLIPEHTHVSCYAWSAGKTLNNNADQLNQFLSIEGDLVNSINDKIDLFDSNGIRKHVTTDLLSDVSKQFITDLSIPDTLIDEDFRIIRVPTQSKIIEPPLPDVLNHCFMSDLSALLETTLNNSINDDIKQYLLSITNDKLSDQNKKHIKHLIKQTAKNEIISTPPLPENPDTNSTDVESIPEAFNDTDTPREEYPLISNEETEHNEYSDILSENKSSQLIEQVQAGYKALPEIIKEKGHISELNKQLSIVAKEIVAAVDHEKALNIEFTDLNKKYDAAISDIKIHSTKKPDVLVRLVAWVKRKNVLQEWLDKLVDIATEITLYKKNTDDTTLHINEANNVIDNLKTQQNLLSTSLNNSRIKLDELNEQLEKAKEVAGDSFEDRDFWKYDNNDALQSALPELEEVVE